MKKNNLRFVATSVMRLLLMACCCALLLITFSPLMGKSAAIKNAATPSSQATRAHTVSQRSPVLANDSKALPESASASRRFSPLNFSEMSEITGSNAQKGRADAINQPFLLPIDLKRLFPTLMSLTQETSATSGLSLSLNPPPGGVSAGQNLKINSSSLNLGVSYSITVEAWVKPSAGGVKQALVSRYQDLSTNGPRVGYLLQLINTDKVRFLVYSESTFPGFGSYSVTSDIAIPPGSGSLNGWHHVAGVFEISPGGGRGGELRVYVDGVRNLTPVSALSPDSASNTTRIGMENNALYFYSGLIDEVRVTDGAVYNLNFVPQRNLAVLLPQVTGFRTVGLWNFDNNANLGADATGNASNVTLQGTPAPTSSTDVPPPPPPVGNTPPTVSITGTTPSPPFTAPATLTVNAVASDPDGDSITQVQFMKDGVNIGAPDTVAPYSVQLTSLLAGTYIMTAVATDSRGASTTSAQFIITVNGSGNNPPTVSITGATPPPPYTAPATITVNATASDPDGEAISVQFKKDGVNVGAPDATLPYSVQLTSLPAGSYSITAVVTDARGASSTSLPLNITVNNGANNPPSVSITSTTPPPPFTAPATLTVNASASDPDGDSITQVQFYKDSVAVGAPDTTAPYSVQLASVAAGSYVMTAVAIDSRGATGTSQQFIITVNGSGGNATATFVRTDTTTQGNWKGAYGSNGYQVVNDSTSFPAYASVSVTGADLFTWASSTNEPRALRKAASPTDRIAATMYSNGSFTINVNLTDGQSHQLGLYLLDWDDPNGRQQRIDILDAANNNLLDSRAVAAYSQGKYLIWTLKGNLKINVTTLAGYNAVVSGLFFDPPGAQPPTSTGLSGFWDFHEGSGGVAGDSSGNSNNGTLLNGTAWDAGPVGSALNFDGVNDTVSLPNSPVLTGITNNFTVSFWALPLASHEIDPVGSTYGGVSGQRYAIGPQQGGVAYGSPLHAGIGVSVGTNGVSVYEHSDGYMPAVVVYQTSLANWTHVTVTYENKQPKLYLNGVLVGTGQQSPESFIHVYPDQIGGMSYGFYQGKLDDLRIFNRVLSATEIQSLADVIWVEDRLPNNAATGGDFEDWSNWVSSNPLPFSGALASQSNIVAGEHQHYFQGTTEKLTVNPGDKLVAYVYLDPANPPSEVMLQWNSDFNGWNHRAYWGANQIAFGADGTNNRRFMGPLPPAGQWARLEAPASQVGLEGLTLNGLAFTLYGGRATWDHAGKSTQSATGNNNPPAVSITSTTPSPPFTAPATLTVNAVASDPDGDSITQVQFMKDGVNIGAPDTVAPYSVQLTSLLAGAYIMTAVATDSRGASTTSQQFIITVNSQNRSPFNGPHNIPGVTQAEDFDNGGEGIAYHDNDTGNGFGNFYRTTDVDIVASGSGFVVGNARTGEWLEYTVNVTTAGSYNILARVASDGPGGKFHYEIDRGTPNVIVTPQITAPNTFNWGVYQDAPAATVALTAGQHILRVSLDLNGTQQFPAIADFDFFTIAAVNTTQPPSPTPPDLTVNQLGRLTSVGNGSMRVFNGYDAWGRSTGTVHKLDGTQYVSLTSYGYPQNAATTPGLGTVPVSQTYPDSERVDYAYDAGGEQQSIKTTPYNGAQRTIVSGVLRNARGQTIAVTYGNNAISIHKHNESTNLRLNQIQTAVGGTLTVVGGIPQISGGTTIQNYGYGFDANGNVTSVMDNVDPSLNAAYDYDKQDQLTSMTANSVTLPYRYDPLGNLTNKENNIQSYGGAQACAGCATARGPHALATAQGVTYNYDPNGNLISASDGTTITWNAENMPAQSVRGGVTTQRFYLGEMLWKKIESGQTTYYLPGVRVEGGQYRKFFGGFAERSPDGTLKFYHGDHLGSASLVTDAGGTVIRKQAYKPYGEDRFVSGSFAPKYQFNFKEKEASGFYDYGARLYNPATGRWLSTDDFATDGLNRYAYVSNNPLRYTDPTGHEQEPRAKKERILLEVVDKKERPKDSGITVQLGNLDTISVKAGPAEGPSTWAESRRVNPPPRRRFTGPAAFLGGYVMGLGGDVRRSLGPASYTDLPAEAAASSWWGTAGRVAGIVTGGFIIKWMRGTEAAAPRPIPPTWRLESGNIAAIGAGRSVPGGYEAVVNNVKNWNLGVNMARVEEVIRFGLPVRVFNAGSVTRAEFIRFINGGYHVAFDPDTAAVWLVK
jgi:RHS repeat-associated protein